MQVHNQTKTTTKKHKQTQTNKQTSKQNKQINTNKKGNATL